MDIISNILKDNNSLSPNKLVSKIMENKISDKEARELIWRALENGKLLVDIDMNLYLNKGK